MDKALDYEKYLPNDYDALFVKCKLSLSDGSTMEGVISVRMRDHQVYLVEFPDNQGKLLQLPLQKSLSEVLEKKKKELSGQVGKSLKDIFPLRYETPFVFIDGLPLKGIITI